VTSNVSERVSLHQEGADHKAYTYKRRPVCLIYQKSFSQIECAIAAEKQIKGWSRAKKDALINGNSNLLHELSMSSEKRRVWRHAH
jgi:putative endonuclease